MRFGLLFLFLGFAASVRAEEAPLDLKQTTITFTGHATLHDFHGAAQEIAGHAQIDPADPNLVTSALLDIGAALLTTFQDTRDEHMRRWLHVDTNPQIEFRLTHITCLSGDPARASRAQPALFTVQAASRLTATSIRWRSRSLAGARAGNLSSTAQRRSTRRSTACRSSASIF